MERWMLTQHAASLQQREYYLDCIMEDELKAIRQELFARRNGALAESLRAHGDPHRLILGCTLSEIAEVAGRHEPSVELAGRLWADGGHRECRLMAPMLCPPGHCGLAEALSWCDTLATAEEADILCHRLLRHTPAAHEVARHLLRRDASLQRYAGFRLALNLQAMGRAIDDDARARAAQELQVTQWPSMRHLLQNLLDE